MIPKIIHIFWFQGRQIPAKYHTTIRNLQSLNPAWQIRLWSDSDFRDHCAKISDDILKCYDSFGHMHQKIDLGRLVILFLYGGVSVDMDVTAHKPFECTPHIQDAKFIVSESSRSRSEMLIFSRGRLSSALNNAIIFCKPQCPYTAHVIETITRVASYNSVFAYFTIQWTTGPFIFTTALKRVLDDQAIVLPSCYFEHREFHPDAILSHHHENTWLPMWFTLTKSCLMAIVSFLQNKIV